MNLPNPQGIIESVLDTLAIDTDVPDAARKEAEHWQTHPGIDDETLVDWRSLPFVTIDNPGSRDLDQALLIEASDNGFRVRYALADAAYYVRPASALFKDALQRGASFYTPLMAVPMLPRLLSEDLVSLNPLVDRRALVFDIRLDAAAAILSTQVLRVRMHSVAQLTYEGVQTLLNADAQNSLSEEELSLSYLPSLRLLKAVGEQLMAQAAERDVVSFDRSSAEFVLEGEPPRFTVALRERVDVERYNEQISLLCNQQGALLMQQLTASSEAAQPVYRVHDAPSARATRDLKTTLTQFADTLQLPAEWRWQPGQSLADYVEALPRQGRDRHRALAVERQILMTWRASEFRPEPGRHHALAVDGYARFSSPMREIVGIFTHKELFDALEGRMESIEADETLRDAVIEAANRARQTQKAIDKAIGLAVIDGLLRNDLEKEAGQRPRRSATIMGFRNDRVYVAVDDFALDLKIYRADLESHTGVQYQFTDIAATPGDTSASTWHLGDRVSLVTRAFDGERARFILDMEAAAAEPTA